MVNESPWVMRLTAYVTPLDWVWCRLPTCTLSIDHSQVEDGESVIYAKSAGKTFALRVSKEQLCSLYNIISQYLEEQVKVIV